MIPISSGARVWIASGHTDMRKGMRGLSLLVRKAWAETRSPATYSSSVAAAGR